MKLLYSVIFFKILNWKMIGTIDPAIRKCVVIVAPHTSWYDFFMGLMVRRLLGVQINFIAKRELFKPPFGWYFRWVGGTALNRTPNQNKVEAITRIFQQKEIFRLALSPEGTRKKTERWKTGFYYIARAAQIPIIKVAFDYGSKEVRVAPPFFATKDTEEDLEEIHSFYDGVVCNKPENF